MKNSKVIIIISTILITFSYVISNDSFEYPYIKQETSNIKIGIYWEMVMGLNISHRNFPNNLIGSAIAPVGMRILNEGLRYTAEFIIEPIITYHSSQIEYIGQSYYVGSNYHLQPYINLSFYYCLPSSKSASLWMGGGFDYLHPSVEVLVNLPVKNFKFQFGGDIEIISYKLVPSFVAKFEMSAGAKREHIWGIKFGLVGSEITEEDGIPYKSDYCPCFEYDYTYKITQLWIGGYYGIF